MESKYKNCIRYMEFLETCGKKNCVSPMHKHHIHPKYDGGINDADNLISLSVEDHIKAHRILYEEFGDIRDLCAVHILSKNKELTLTKEELSLIGQKGGLASTKKLSKEQLKFRANLAKAAISPQERINNGKKGMKSYLEKYTKEERSNFLKNGKKLSILEIKSKQEKIEQSMKRNGKSHHGNIQNMKNAIKSRSKEEAVKIALSGAKASVESRRKKAIGKIITLLVSRPVR